jgi:hypothetical protein
MGAAGAGNRCHAWSRGETIPARGGQVGTASGSGSGSVSAAGFPRASVAAATMVAAAAAATARNYTKQPVAAGATAGNDAKAPVATAASGAGEDTHDRIIAGCYDLIMCEDSQAKPPGQVFMAGAQGGAEGPACGASKSCPIRAQQSSSSSRGLESQHGSNTKQLCQHDGTSCHRGTGFGVSVASAVEAWPMVQPGGSTGASVQSVGWVQAQLTHNQQQQRADSQRAGTTGLATGPLLADWVVMLIRSMQQQQQQHQEEQQQQ